MNKFERDLVAEIETIRHHLMMVAAIKGYTHQDTIQISQQLDELLNKYNRVHPRRKKPAHHPAFPHFESI